MPMSSLPRARRIAAPVAGLVLPVLLTVILSHTRGTLNVTTDTLLFLLAVIGVVSAVLASITTSVLLNYYFVPPIHQFTINEANNVLALIVFAVVAVTVATVVDQSLRLSRRAAKATVEAEPLSSLVGSILRGDHGVRALLQRTKEAFGMATAELRHRTTDDAEHAGTGPGAAASPGEGTDVVVPVGPDDVLVLRGRQLAASERWVFVAFAGHVAAALERARLAEAAGEVEPVRAADRMRTALLAAVSHDLRTPIASGWAAVSSLRSRDVHFSDEDRDELLATAEESLVRLNRLVDNLLDLSRLQAGALTLNLQPTALAEVLPLALDTLPQTKALVVTQGVDEIGDILGDRVELRVIDQGPGLRPEDHDRIQSRFVVGADLGQHQTGAVHRILAFHQHRAVFFLTSSRAGPGWGPKWSSPEPTHASVPSRSVGEPGLRAGAMASAGVT